MIGTRTLAAPRTRGSQAIAVAIAIALLAAVTGPGWADEALETRQLVGQAKFAVESFGTDPKMGAFRDLIKRAKGVFIAPQLLKAAFVVGASGGSGVLVVRDQNTGQWHGPAFYTLGGASFGLQIGADASEVIVLAMTERGVNAMLQPSVKLGADASLTVGPVGAGAGVATENLSVDLVAFSFQGTLWRRLPPGGGPRSPDRMEPDLLRKATYDEGHSDPRRGESAGGGIPRGGHEGGRAQEKCSSARIERREPVV